VQANTASPGRRATTSNQRSWAQGLAALAGLAVWGIAPEAHASHGADHGDVAWILTSSAIVLMMTIPGLALFYGGLVRVKNVLSILMQCLATLAIVSVIWVLWGYSIAFGDDVVGGLFGSPFQLFLLEGVSTDAGPADRGRSSWARSRSA